MFYSYKKQRPISWNDFPNRIRLSSGFTKTDKTTFTPDDIQDAGYLVVEDPPIINNEHKNYLDWDEESCTWVVKDYDYNTRVDEVNLWKSKLLKLVDKNIENYERDLRLGLEPSCSLQDLKEFVIELESIDKQEGYPYYVSYPTKNLKGFNTYGES